MVRQLTSFGIVVAKAHADARVLGSRYIRELLNDNDNKMVSLDSPF